VVVVSLKTSGDHQATPGEAAEPGTGSGRDRVATIGYSISGRVASGAGDTPDRTDRLPRRRRLVREATAVDIS